MEPRQVIPGSTYHVVTRTCRRTFLLRPDEPITRHVRYCLAYAASCHGILLHDFEFMSNHAHINLTDPGGNLPAFMHQLDTLLARGINALRGSKGTVFEKAYSAIRILDEDTFRTFAVYTLANPCSAGLVERADEWIGASSLGMEYGETVTIRRPSEGLWAASAAREAVRRLVVGEERSRDVPGRRRRKAAKDPSSGRLEKRGKPSKLPDEVQLTLVRPIFEASAVTASATEISSAPSSAGLTSQPDVVAIKPDPDADLHARQEIRALLALSEAKLAEERRRTGKRVLGMKRVMAQDPRSCPELEEALFSRVTLIAARSKFAKLEAQLRSRQFCKDYRARYRAWLAGNRDSPWPPGSYQIPRRHNMTCASCWPVAEPIG